MAKKLGEFIEFSEDEIYEKITSQRNGEVDDIVGMIDAEEAKVNRMSEEQIVLEQKANLINTQRNKHKFIAEMKDGLGQKIKENPTNIKRIKHKLTFMDRIKQFFKRF